MLKTISSMCLPLFNLLSVGEGKLEKFQDLSSICMSNCLLPHCILLSRHLQTALSIFHPPFFFFLGIEIQLAELVPFLFPSLNESIVSCFSSFWYFAHPP